MLHISRAKAQETVSKKLEGASVRARAVDFLSVYSIVKSLNECARELNQIAGVEPSIEPYVRDAVTQSSFQTVRLLWRGHLKQASSLFVSNWHSCLGLYLDIKKPVAPLKFGKTKPLLPDEDESELLSVFNAAVSAILRAEANETEGRSTLRRLATYLGLSQDELGRMFGVSGETIRRWERGHHRIPSGKLAELVTANENLTRLLELFRPERLPQAIRRKAELFGGETALDWILRGRIADVVDRYEMALAYQA